MSDLAAGALAGLAVAMPVGAIGAYLVALASRARFGVALAAALGVATTDGLYALVAGLAGAAVTQVLGGVLDWLRLLAALVLVALAVRTVISAVRRHQDADPASPGTDSSPRRAYLAMVGLTAINPATVLTFTAVALAHPSLTSSAEPSALGAVAVGAFAFGAFAASAGWQLVLVGGGSLLGRTVRGRRGQLVIALCSAAIMVALAVAALVG
jgi:threonine/homoserine/homoserine lactone efflux protein